MEPDELLYISIISLLFMGMFMYFLGHKSYQLTKNASLDCETKDYTNVYYFIALFFFAIMCGLRFRCGADCESYVDGYERLVAGHSMSSYRDRVEPLFELIARFMAQIEVGRVIYLGVWAFIEITFFYSALRSRNYLLPFIGLVLILGPHFNSWNNGIRQVIASCIFVYAIVGLLDGGKIWKYLIWIAVAYYIHKSSLILVPLCFLKFYNVKPKAYIALVILLWSVFVGQTGAFDFAFDKAEEALSFMDYDNYAKKFDDIVEEESTITSYGPRRITLLISYILIILFSEKMDTFYEEDRLFRVSFLLFMVYACATEMLISYDIILTRPFLYCMPFLLVCSAYLLFYLKNTQRTLLFLMALVCMCSFSLIASVASYDTPQEETLYKFIFLQQSRF